MADLQRLTEQQKENLERVKMLTKKVSMNYYIKQYESYYTIAYHSIGNLTEESEEGLK
jgi:hypothetical protein